MVRASVSASPSALPIDPLIPQVIAELKAHSSVVLQAAPGAGKTTRIPPALLDADFFLPDHREILVLEPRRLAAKLAARRVAEERGEAVGETVGYQFRFENVSGPKTRLRFLTEGMLMRRLIGNPELWGVGAVILDEFHERHLHTDIAISFLRRLQQTTRPDLRILVMSATLEMGPLSLYLGGARTFHSEGRQYEVRLEYLGSPPVRTVGNTRPKPLENQVRDAVEHALSGQMSNQADTPGNILVFLPGMGEIRRAADALVDLARRARLLVVPLHGDLSREEQDEAIRPTVDRIKVILSTNVAETSVTIPGVTAVIDSGLARMASYSWWSGLPALTTRPISKASAIQRAGRAGRTAPGVCYRLYGKNDFDGKPSFEMPEISRADLSQTVLELKALGIKDLAGFSWFEKPPENALDSAERLLQRLGAVDLKGEITTLGRRMVEMPTHPRLSRLVLEADARGILDQGAGLASLISEGRLEGGTDLMSHFERFRSGAGADRHMTQLRERLIQAANRSAERSAGPVKAPNLASTEEVLKLSLLRGFPDRVARKRPQAGGVQQAALGGQVELVFSSGGSAMVENSALISGAEYFLVIDAEERKASFETKSRVWVRLLCTIKPEWLFDIEPLGVEEKEELIWDEARQRIEAVERITYDQLVLDESRSAPRDLGRAADLLIEKILGRPAQTAGQAPGTEWGKICDWEELLGFLARIGLLAREAPELGIPGFDDPMLRKSLQELAAGKTSLEQLKSEAFIPHLLGSLNGDQRKKLESWTPAQVQLSRGRRVTVNYEVGKPPWIESRLQDFFGMAEGPKLLGGRVPLTLHLLAPNRRAVQVTSDLSGFWKRVYPELRRELGRRYPRHAWPEDPMAG